MTRMSGSVSPFHVSLIKDGGVGVAKSQLKQVNIQTEVEINLGWTASFVTAVSKARAVDQLAELLVC